MMSNLDSTEVPSGTPVFLDMFSGPNCPLSKALLWCGWSVVSPIDIAIDEDLDVTRLQFRMPSLLSCLRFMPHVQQWTAPLRPEPERSDQVHYHCVMILIPVACLPCRGLTWSGSLRTIWPQTLLYPFRIGCIHVGGRPCERILSIAFTGKTRWRHLLPSLGNGWTLSTMPACSMGPGGRGSKFVTMYLTELAQLPLLRCGHLHDPHEWRRDGTNYPTKEEAEYTPSLVFTLAICLTAWAARTQSSQFQDCRQSKHQGMFVLYWPGRPLHCELT